MIFITHNPHHAYPVGDRFLILNRGRSLGNFAKSRDQPRRADELMAGGAELEELAHELESRGPGGGAMTKSVRMTACSSC